MKDLVLRNSVHELYAAVDMMLSATPATEDSKIMRSWLMDLLDIVNDLKESCDETVVPMKEQKLYLLKEKNK